MWAAVTKLIGQNQSEKASRKSHSSKCDFRYIFNKHLDTFVYINK